jgi:hypothetical protein
MLLMLTVASQAISSGVGTITPDEPATLQLALVGLGMLAIYAAWTGWRPRRSAIDEREQTVADSESPTTRRAA